MATTKVNVSKISDFPKVTPAGTDQILVEKDGQGGSITLSQIPVSTPVNDKISEEVNKLNSQINDLAFLPEGSSVADAELINIRTPADGFTVPAGSNAGNAVRAQVTQLDEKISNLKGDLSGIANESNSREHILWSDGGIDLSNGQDTANPSYYRTDNYYKGSDYSKITVSDIETYGFKYSYSGGVYTYVSGFQIISEYSFENNDPYYYRFAPQKASFADSKINLIYTTQIVKDIIALKQLEPKVEELEESTIITNRKSLYDTSNFTNEYLNWADGTTTSNDYGRTSPYIEVSEGQIINYSLTAIGEISPVIACYDSGKVYQQIYSIKALGNGSWNLNTGSLTVPSGIKYIRYSSCRITTTTDSISIDTVETLKEYVLDNVANQWNGKKWAAFGTSITDTSYTDVHFLQPTGKYVPFLIDMSGMVVTNYGMEGGSILSDIMNRVLTTDVSGFDIVTVEGSVNDHATSKPIGEVGDTGTDTFAGAIYQIAKHVYETSNATLFFITDYVGRYVHINPAPDGSDFYGDCSPTKVNNDNLLQIDYINMMIKQCEYFGIPCITAGQDAGINLLTGNLYLMDHIHSSYVGGKQYAETIWKELKQYRPRVLSV